MPCDIGYKSYARVRVPVPEPQELREEIKPPEIDTDLLDKLGEDDPEFLGWLQGLDIKPLLEEALRQTIAKIGDLGINVFISDNGYLVVRSTFRTEEEKRKIERSVTRFSNQFQMEVLAIVAQLLDYDTQIRNESVSNNLVLEGEKHASLGVHRYLKVTIGKSGEGSIVFEHFESERALTVEQNKFLGLAEKLGVKIAALETRRSGQPIPAGVVHKDFLKETGK